MSRSNQTLQAALAGGVTGAGALCALSAKAGVDSYSIIECSAGGAVNCQLPVPTNSGLPGVPPAEDTPGTNVFTTVVNVGAVNAITMVNPAPGPGALLTMAGTTVIAAGQGATFVWSVSQQLWFKV